MVRVGPGVLLRGPSPILKSNDVGKNGERNFGEVMIAYLVRDDVRFFLYVIGPCVKCVSNAAKWSYCWLGKAYGRLGEELRGQLGRAMVS